MISIKQIKSDTSGPIIYQGATRLERSTDFIWDNAIKELQVNGSIKLGGDVLIYNDTFNTGNQITKIYCADGVGLYDINLINAYEYSVFVNSQTPAGNIRVHSTNPAFEGAVYTNDFSANFVNESLVTKRYVDSVAGSTYTFNNGITNTLGTVQLGGALIQDTIVDGATNAWSMTFSNIKQFVAGADSFNLNSLTFVDIYAIGDINITGANHLGTYTGSFTTVADDLTFSSTLLTLFNSANVQLTATTTIDLDSTGNLAMTAGATGMSLSTNTGGDIAINSVNNLSLVASTGNLSINLYNTPQTIALNGADNNMIVTDAVSGKGLVYATDYSASFTPESLVSKRYVDSITGALGLSTVLTIDNTSGGSNILFTAGSGIDATATVGTDTLNIGTGNADVINIGRTGVTVNIFGTRNFIQTTDVEILDKLIVLNKNGGASTGFGTGFEIEENALITGYFKTNGTADGWLFKAPTSFQFELSSSTLTANRSLIIPNNSGTIALVSDLTGGYVPYTGATSNVVLGAFDLDANHINTGSLSITGTAGNGHIHLKHQSAISTTLPNATTLYADVNGNVGFINDGLFQALFIWNTNTANRSYTLPDVSGTVITTGNLTDITAVGTITSGTWNGTLIGTTYGGTGTSTTFTAGSIVFAGASGVYTQDNANFFWDATNTRLGIKTNAPAKTLHVAGDIRFEPVSGVLMDIQSATINTTTAATTSIQLIAIPTGAVVMIEARVHSRKTGGAGVGTTGDGNAYIRTVKAKNVGGTVTIGTVASTFTSEDIAAFNATLSVSGTNVSVDVSGAVNDNVTWTSTCIITR